MINDRSDNVVEHVLRPFAEAVDAGREVRDWIAVWTGNHRE